MRLLALLILAPSLAQAAFHPCATEGLVAQAVTVVQIGQVAADLPGSGPTCRVEGVVVAAFRGGAAVGEPLGADVPCRPDGGPGPTIWHEPRSLRAPVLELHLDADGRVAGHGAGLVRLEEPTDAVAYRFACPTP